MDGGHGRPFHECAVAGVFDNMAAGFGDGGRHNFFHKGPDPGESAGLVQFHKARVPGHISCTHGRIACCKSGLHPLAHLPQNRNPCGGAGRRGLVAPAPEIVGGELQERNDLSETQARVPVCDMSARVTDARSGLLHAARGWAGDLAAVALVGLFTATFTLSFAALLFGAAPGTVPAQGLFVLLVSSMVLCTTTALLGSFPFAVSSLEGTTIVALSGGAAAITAALASGPEAVLSATLMAGLSLTAIITGGVTLLIASTGFGEAVRYLPLQVVAGLLAGTGWALLAGGAAVAVGHQLVPVSLLDPAVLGRIGASLLAAAVLVLGTRRWTQAAVLPLLVGLEVAAYHAGARLVGWSVVQQRAEGWLLQPPSGLHPVVPWSPPMIAAIDWPVLISQWPALVATSVVTIIGLLLNLSGIEIETNREADFNRDLRAGAIANLVVGLCGGAPGMLSMSRSMLLRRLGSRRRATTIVTGLAAGLVPMLVPGLLGVVPRPVLGALLIFIAWGMLKTWLIDVRKRLTRIEWATVGAVVLVVIQFGLAGGVVAGIALGCATFALAYSRASPIRARFKGDVAQSNAARSDAERAMLDQQADATLVLYLQGFLFFGTTNRLLLDVRAELNAAGGRLRHLVLDGSNIDGLDGSALTTLERIVSATRAHKTELVFAGFPAAARQHMAGLLAEPGVRAMATLDEALETAEDSLLIGQPTGVARPLPDLLTDECEHAADAAALLAAFDIAELSAGAALVRQGEASDDLVFIEAGTASVVIAVNGGTHRARRCGPGAMVGEIGFLLGKPRTATVQADAPMRVRVLTRARFTTLQTDHPRAAEALQRTIMRQLAGRLLDRDAMIHSLLRATRSAEPRG